MTGRLGGDEFVVVLSGQGDEDVALEVAERLRRAARQQIHLGEEEISRAASLGVAWGIPGEMTFPT
jgi:GGDEF domain-containing protein